jgi:hypothetical protein
MYLEMSPIEQDLLQALLELESTVQSMPKLDPKPDLRPLFAKLDHLTSQLPADADSQLLHYLRKKSYQKARLFLEGRDAENQVGNCGHV